MWSRPFARLTCNIWQASARHLKRRGRAAHSVAHRLRSRERGETSVASPSAPSQHFSRQPFVRCVSNYTTKRSMGKKGDSVMLTGGPRRRRQRKTKPKTKRARSTRRSEALWSKTSNNHQNLQTEEVDRLLASALRYWEAKRDLIEERISTIRGATAPS